MLAALNARLLLHFELDKIALFYLGTPILISIVLYWTDTVPGRNSLAKHTAEATAVLVLTSVVLFEGVICFVFAARR